MKCPNCGAENDAANRFCDQCGTALEAPTPVATMAAMVASQPTAAAATCPNCGATVLPGEAFCDECGTPLNVVPPAAQSHDAPTIIAPPTSGAPATGEPAPAGSITCAACGYVNLPGDNFCDNCGAALTPAGQSAVEQATSSNATIPEPVAASEAPETITEPPAITVTEPPAVEAPPATDAPEPAPPAQPDEVPADAVTATAPPAEAGATTAVVPPDATSAAPGYDAQKQALEAEIARQQQVISQLEPVQNALGPATPAGVAQSLSDARDALAKIQAELDALAPPAPAIDPAEVQRIEAEIARQQQVISQLEPVQNALGAATPAGVAQSLSDARDALATAQAELAALTGSTPTATAAPVPANTAQPAPPPPTVEPPGTAPFGPPNGGAAPDDLTVVAPPPAPPAPKTARLVLDDGRELVLPLDKSEATIGREDPISGIHPEIDLTPHGGENGGVSRQHARLAQVAGQWTITDLNSTNQTRVDGARIDPGVPVPIRDGVRLQFGKVGATFKA